MLAQNYDNSFKEFHSLDAPNFVRAVASATSAEAGVASATSATTLRSYASTRFIYVLVIILQVQATWLSQ